MCHSMYATFKAFAFQHLFTEEQHVKIALLKSVQIPSFVPTVKRDRPKIGAVFNRYHNENACCAFRSFEKP